MRMLNYYLSTALTFDLEFSVIKTYISPKYRYMSNVRDGNTQTK